MNNFYMAPDMDKILRRTKPTTRLSVWLEAVKKLEVLNHLSDIVILRGIRKTNLENLLPNPPLEPNDCGYSMLHIHLDCAGGLNHSLSIRRTEPTLDMELQERADRVALMRCILCIWELHTQQTGAVCTLEAWKTLLKVVKGLHSMNLSEKSLVQRERELSESNVHVRGFQVGELLNL